MSQLILKINIKTQNVKTWSNNPIPTTRREPSLDGTDRKLIYTFPNKKTKICKQIWQEHTQTSQTQDNNEQMATKKTTKTHKNGKL